MKNCFIELHSINTRPPLQLMSKVESESLLNYTADNYCPY